MVVKAPFSRATPASRHITPVSIWDLRMHRHLTVSGYPCPSLQIPLLWNASELEVSSSELIQYCTCKPTI
jgi:hypothetical protein